MKLSLCSHIEKIIIMEKGTVVVVVEAAATRSSIDEELEGNACFLRTVETLLRLFPIGLCVTALVIMLKNSQQNEYGSVAYSDLGAFRYLVHANGFCAGYSLFTAIIVALPRSYTTITRAWTFFMLDQVVTYLILAVGAVSAEVLYLAKKGVPSAAWSSACGSFGPFCHKVTASVAITFAAVACYVLLSLISSYRLFSKYDAPAPVLNKPNKENDITG